MQSRKALRLCAIWAFLFAGVWLGCSPDSPSTASPDGGAKDAGEGGPNSGVDSSIADAGSPDTYSLDAGSPDGVSLDSAPPDAGQADTGLTDSDSLDADQDARLADASDDVGGVSCSTYCAAVMAGCHGANAQYMDYASCMNACQYLPLGMATDPFGDSVGCRTAHALLAKAMPIPHCWHAGPFGYGGCGEPCEGFCDIAVGLCSPKGGFDAGAPPYNSAGDCTLRCAGYTQVATSTNLVIPPGVVGSDGGYYAYGPDGGNTLDCREYYLGSALQSAAAEQLHCKDVGSSSPTCM